MPNPLRNIARFFRNTLEIRMNPLMQTELTTGAIIDVDGLVDLDLYGELIDYGVDAPEIHEAQSVIPGLERSRTVSLSPSVALPVLAGAPIDAALSGKLEQATSMTIGMTEVDAKYMKQSELDRAIRDIIDAEGHKGRLASALKIHHRRIVWKEYWGKLNVTLTRTGSGGAEVAAEVADIGEVELGGAWTWTSAATLESTEPRLFALELSRWSVSKGRLEPRS